MAKSLYATLNVSENASSDEIKRAYRKLARQYHPDINKTSEAEDKFKEINAAYEILSDPQKKKEYDMYGDAMFNGQSFGDYMHSQGNVDINDLLKNIFGSFGGYNSGHNRFGGFSGFNDMGSRAIDLDIEANVRIPLRTAINGDKVRLNVSGTSFDMTIPEGTKDGSRLRASGKGKKLGSMVGDAIITVKIEEQDGYQIDNLDLIQDIKIPLKVALFGGKVKIQTMQKEITVKINENTHNGKKMRVSGMGFRDLKTGARGDLFLRVAVELPNSKNLSQELKELMQKEL